MRYTCHNTIFLFIYFCVCPLSHAGGWGVEGTQARGRPRPHTLVPPPGGRLTGAAGAGGFHAPGPSQPDVGNGTHALQVCVCVCACVWCMCVWGGATSCDHQLVWQAACS